MTKLIDPRPARHAPATWRSFPGRLRACAAALPLVMLCVGAAQAQPAPGRFDGAWSVTLVCAANPDISGARGYSHRFDARVADGRLSGTYGKEGELGWLHLNGPIAADGKATLRVQGIVGDQRYAARGAPTGSGYAYPVAAQFDERRGTGQRLEQRNCSFEFERQ